MKNDNKPVHSPNILLYKNISDEGVLFSSLMVSGGEVFFKACVPPENMKFDIYRRNGQWEIYLEGMGLKAGSVPLALADEEIAVKDLAGKIARYSAFASCELDAALLVSNLSNPDQILVIHVDRSSPSRLLMLESLADNFVDHVLPSISRPVGKSDALPVKERSAWLVPAEKVEPVAGLLRNVRMRPLLLPLTQAREILGINEESEKLSVLFDIDRQGESPVMSYRIVETSGNRLLGTMPSPGWLAESFCRLAQTTMRLEQDERQDEAPKC